MENTNVEGPIWKVIRTESGSVSFENDKGERPSYGNDIKLSESEIQEMINDYTGNDPVGYIEGLLEEKELAVVDSLELTKEEKELENVLTGSKDFKEVLEKITAPVNSVVEESFHVIDSSPVMRTTDVLNEMNKEVGDIYDDIINDDSKAMQIAKSIPLIGFLAKKLDSGVDDAKFNLKDIRGKIEYIFSKFDTTQQELAKSIDMRVKLLEGIEQNEGKLKAYVRLMDMKQGQLQKRIGEADGDDLRKLQAFDTQFSIANQNLVALTSNLQLSKQRLYAAVQDGNAIAIQMKISQPILKTLLSTAIVETSGMKANEGAIKALSETGAMIDKMSSDLTRRTVESSNKTAELINKGVFDSQQFINNVKTLKTHFDQIEDKVQGLREKYEQEKKGVLEAQKELESIKTVQNSKELKEINSEMLLD